MAPRDPSFADRVAALAAARERLGSLKTTTVVGSGIALVVLAGVIAFGTNTDASGATQNGAGSSSTDNSGAGSGQGSGTGGDLGGAPGGNQPGRVDPGAGSAQQAPQQAPSRRAPRIVTAQS